MSSADSQLYARSFTDVYDNWYGDLDDPTHVVDAVARHHPAPALLLELGSGTGRLATPLHHGRYQVLALDVSCDMLARAPSGPHSLAADMTSLPLGADSVDVVLIAYNTLFNVATHELQQQCLTEIARVLRVTGSLAVEGFISPADSPAEFGVSRRAHPTRAGEELSIITGPHPTLSDVIVGSHIEAGSTRTCRPWQLAYQSPHQLDACAERAGLGLYQRFSDWAGTRFDAEAVRHVTWYKAARSDLR